MTKTHLRSKIHLGIRILGVCAIITVFTIPAYAYSTHSWKLSSKAASYTWGANLQSSGVIKNAWKTADDDWYSASSINFYYYPNSENVLNSFYESSSTLYGRTSITQSGGIVKTFVAMLNAENGNIGKNNVARSTANHEFGHVLGIDDLTSGTAIMNVHRNRETVYVPQADDKNGIAAIYK